MTGEQLYNLIQKASCDLGLHRTENVAVPSHRPGIAQWYELDERVRQVCDKAASNLCHLDSVVNAKFKLA